MEYLILVIIFIFGLGVGSFLNVVILRLPEQRSIARGRSQCPACGRILAWYELIPLASFFALRARCKSCKAPISWQYPIVEFVTGVLFVVTWYVHAYSGMTSSQFPISNFQFPNFYFITQLLSYLFYISVLLVIFVQDFRWGVILDRVTVPAIVLTLVFQLLLSPTIVPLTTLGLGMLIGGGFFALQYVLSRGRWIGGGDIRLGALMGAMLGWQLVIVALMLAYVGGAVIALPLLIFRIKHLGDALPFGIFLVPATIITLFYGEAIMRWYFNLVYIV
ncbi:prepilin peptidase [Candidatus Uhrbacteria bacterium]|nr:prepilin peptidase [Candidatus Uhrbacteria bacterium]